MPSSRPAPRPTLPLTRADLTTGRALELPDRPGEDLDRRLRTEWLLTDGRGGYAMGTAGGANTRRYHGLLVAATRPPLGRFLALHSVVEALERPQGRVELSTHVFGRDEVRHPDGWRRLVRFELLSPREARWTWSDDDLLVERVLALEPEEAGVRLDYTVRLRTAGRATLHLRPLVSLRDFHELLHEGRGTEFTVERAPHGLLVRRGEHRLELASDHGRWHDDPDWWRDFAYPEDRARGQDWREDAFTPGLLCVECSGDVAGVTLRARMDAAASAASHGGRDAARAPGTRTRVPAPRAAAEPRSLVEAATAFVVSGGDRDSILAGYPWFADWGRDSMIALPGLLLRTGRVDHALGTLRAFARRMKNGVIPNRFDDAGEGTHHNTVDASLWFIHAAHETARVAGRRQPEDLLHACREIVRAYRDGTDFGIGTDDDGLVVAGRDDTALTWMDARRDGVTFTPRRGKAVEVNALWHHGLHALASMETDREASEELLRLAARVRRSFNERFFWPDRGPRGCLHDVLTPRDDGSFAPDGTFRPNQIVAAALEHGPLDRERRAAVVAAVRETLLTPFGLRTLDPDDPDYRGRYEGDLFERDASYHQGTVWPWLIGPFVEASIRAAEAGRVDDARARARRDLRPLIDELHAPGRGAFGQIAEVYDGDPPHRPDGCPAQAWSVAEVLRAWHLAHGPRSGFRRIAHAAASE